jgi:hypothetical protein
MLLDQQPGRHSIGRGQRRPGVKRQRLGSSVLDRRRPYIRADARSASKIRRVQRSNWGMRMKNVKFAAIGVLLTLPFSLPANALTCAEQAQVCARIARERARPQFAPKCLASARIAECRKTCVWTGTDGRQFPASGDCKPR